MWFYTHCAIEVLVEIFPVISRNDISFLWWLKGLFWPQSLMQCLVVIFYCWWLLSSQIKDDTRRPVYCALIRLLQDRDLCVRVCNTLFPSRIPVLAFGFIPKIFLVLLNFFWIIPAGSIPIFVFSYWWCQLLGAWIFRSSAYLLGFMLQLNWGSARVWLKGIAWWMFLSLSYTKTYFWSLTTFSFKEKTPGMYFRSSIEVCFHMVGINCYCYLEFVRLHNFSILFKVSSLSINMTIILSC